MLLDVALGVKGHDLKSLRVEKNNTKRLNYKVIDIYKMSRVWLFRGLNTPLLFDMFSRFMAAFLSATHVIQPAAWGSGEKACMECRSFMFESHQGYTFRRGAIFTDDINLINYSFK